MRHILLILGVVTIGICILFFSWLPLPDIGSLPIFPKVIGKWINHFGNLRTAIPFFLVALLLEFSLENTPRYRKWISPGSFLLVTLAEVGQLLLPKRHFDVWDIFWGTAGAVAGIGAGVVAREVTRRVRKGVEKGVWKFERVWENSLKVWKKVWEFERVWQKGLQVWRSLTGFDSLNWFGPSNLKQSNFQTLKPSNSQTLKPLNLTL